MKLNIFGRTVLIKIKKIDDKLCGYFDVGKFEIVLNSEAPNKFHTLAHEMFHSAWFRSGIGQTQISSDLHEIIVENFATVLDENFDTLVKARKELKKI